MPPKNELFSVRIGNDLSDRVDEIVEERKENTPDYEDEPTDPEVRRGILKAGVEAHEKGESDVSRLNRRVDELAQEKEELENQLSNPTIGEWVDITKRHGPVASFVLFAGLTVAATLYLTFLAVLDARGIYTPSDLEAQFIIGAIAVFIVLAVAVPAVLSAIRSIRSSRAGR